MAKVRRCLKPLSREAQEARKPLPPEFLIATSWDRVEDPEMRARPAKVFRVRKPR